MPRQLSYDPVNIRRRENYRYNKAQERIWKRWKNSSVDEHGNRYIDGKKNRAYLRQLDHTIYAYRCLECNQVWKIYQNEYHSTECSRFNCSEALY
jgi:hypothetical protein